MKTVLPVLLFFLLPCLPAAYLTTATPNALFQIAHGDPSVEYIVEDLEGRLVFVEKDTRPQAVGILPIETDAEAVRVKAEDVNRRRVRVEEHPFLANTFLIFGTGKIWIDVMYVDFDDKKWDWDDFVIDLGDSDPDEPDEPDNPDNPDDSKVPEDKFDNLGRRMDQKADSIALDDTVRQEVAEVYFYVAREMEAFNIRTASDARKIVNTRLELVNLTEDAKKVMEIANQDSASRQPLPWDDLILWVRAVGNGFKGD